MAACAALLIAAKYGDEKQRVPKIWELKAMCGGSLYHEDMFTQMEWHVLNTLKWNVGHPTIDAWLKLAPEDYSAYKGVEVKHMAQYLCEISLYHKEFVSIRPSVMARASLVLSRRILGCPDGLGIWDHEVSSALLKLSYRLDCPSQAMFQKYASRRISSVSILLEHFLRQQESMSKPTILPTPLFEPDMQVLVQNQGVFPSIPRTGLGNMADSYLTPPITPEEGCILNENEPAIPRVRSLSTIWKPRCQW